MHFVQSQRCCSVCVRRNSPYPVTTSPMAGPPNRLQFGGTYTAEILSVRGDVGPARSASPGPTRLHGCPISFLFSG